LNLCEKYPVPWRIIRSHVHKLLGDWFSLQPHIREDFNKQYKVTFEYLYDMVDQLRETGTRIPLYRKSTEMEPTESYTDQNS
jgi:tRNA-dihydrouridine synthase 1